ncbi:MAG: c-type cytochrome [Desulfuromusa sp.]|nr:c-type cytochrome [Desulfuromusa sp.]
MRLITMMFVLAACLVFVGCSKEENKTSSAPQPAEKPAVVEKTEQVVQKVEEKVAEVTEQAKEKVAEVTEQAKEKAAVVTEQAKEKVEQVKAQTQGLIASTQSAMPSGTGQTVYSKSCSSCHKLGIIGAPKTGDKTAWAPLISDGVEKLVDNSIKGIGKMPARGGNSKLTDDEVKAAVEYMVEQSK